MILGWDPALVFGEILGIIKGSEAAIGKEGCLDKDTYLSSGGRSGRGIPPQTKETIYALFNTYTRIKQEYLEYDAADRSAPQKHSSKYK